MGEPRTSLQRIGSIVSDRFESEKRVLSMDEYLTLFQHNPWRHTRDASRFMKDAFEYYGQYEVPFLGTTTTRFRLFDLDFAKQENGGTTRHDFLVGHEPLQQSFYRIIRNFVREGRTNRLILLHGPNGSAKSTFVNCLMRALEHYSEQDEGALYRFSWIFPRGSDGKTIGFGSRDPLVGPGGTYAHLPEDQIDVKLTSELRENPLLLLPPEERRRMIEEAYAAAGVELPPPNTLLGDNLGHKNRQVYEALLTAYRGDLGKVLAHIRVERYYLSRRYRVGCVTIGPQMAVDAVERQISADRSLGALPASLSSLNLFETLGELVDASGGVLEFSDLLKRPLDAWRYLLLSIETGDVSLKFSILPLNAVLVATSNELHLTAFREHHEYRSFRGRLSMVRVPYLLNYRQEQGIYDSQIVPQVRRHVAPHATYVAALWAVLTRLRKPQAESFENPKLVELVVDLTPLEKAELYADATIPSRLTSEQVVELRAGLEALGHESDHWPNYEGLTGASPREIRTLLLDAAQDPAYDCLSPLAVFEHISRLCESDDYEFLREKPEGGFHDHRDFLRQVRGRWLDRVDEEFRDSTGLVEETQYIDLFTRYVTHVSYWIKGERVYNEVTGAFEDPDQGLLENVEGMLGLSLGELDDFRRHLISTVAGHAIDHPGQTPDYTRLFPRYLSKVREATYATRRRQLGAIAEDILVLLSGEDGAGDALDPEAHRLAQTTLQTLKREYGYSDSSARDAVDQLHLHRYSVAR